MPIRFHNSLTRDKQAFVPLDPAGKRVTFYTCGPTVYGPFHIGNARAFVCMDVARRWLMHRGYDVAYVQNITDVDDKIINRAHDENTTPEEVARRYTALFHEHLAMLGNLPATAHPRATEYIGSMVAAIAELIKRGHAYATPDGSAWFDVGSFPEYGKLSRRPLDQMSQGERVTGEQLAMKKGPLDFALWKASKPGEPAWDAPWGRGRPGWHIECSCMAHDCLGETIDIHSGGSDLLFPHHENEIAQSECLGRKPFARYWLHNGFLNIDGEKMSKSLGNVLTMDKVAEKLDPLTTRLFLISAHYRAPQDLTDEGLRSARSAAKRLAEASREAEGAVRGRALPEDWRSDNELAGLHANFEAAMDDDLGTPDALGAMFQLVTLVNTLRVRAQGGDGSVLPRLSRAAALLLELRGFLGLARELERHEEGLGGESRLAEELLAILIEARAQARTAKQFGIGDMIRKRLSDLGIQLEDRPGETVWKKTAE